MNTDNIAFGQFLRKLMRMYKIKNIDAAKELTLSSPHISQFFNGTAIPSRSQYDKLLNMLLAKGMTQGEEDMLNSLFIVSKTGIVLKSFVNTTTGSGSSNPNLFVKDSGELLLLQMFRSLDIQKQTEVLSYIKDSLSS